jgi:NADH-quinone oxidoreductase subunit A
LVAILFVIFDLETMFVFSWGVSLPDVNSNGFWIMFDFIFELLVGYVYIWKTGAFDW